MANPPKITLDIVQEAFTDAFRAEVGVGLRKDGTPKQQKSAVSEKTGIEPRQISAYAAGDAVPTLHKFLCLAAVLPPDFTNQLLELAGLSGAGRLNLSAGSLDVLSKASRISAMIADHLMDGRLDHLELAEQEPIIRELHEVTGRWLRQHAMAPGLRAIEGGRS